MDILDLIFPKVCLECGKSGKYICETCLRKVDVLNHFNPKTSTFSIFAYEGVVRKAIIKLKYKFAYDIAQELADICASNLKASVYSLMPNVCLIPIPLYQSRERWRGFNQSEIVGKLLAEKLNWRFEPNILIRTSGGKTQVGLNGIERVRNIRGKFAVNNEALSVILSDPERKSNGESKNPLCFVVFDDVATTGSTLQEAIKTLQKAVGPEQSRKIIGLTVTK